MWLETPLWRESRGEMPISISSSPQEAAIAICQWEQGQRGQQMAENIIIYCLGRRLCCCLCLVWARVCRAPQAAGGGLSPRGNDLGLAVKKEIPGNVQQHHKGEQERLGKVCPLWMFLVPPSPAKVGGTAGCTGGVTVPSLCGTDVPWSHRGGNCCWAAVSGVGSRDSELCWDSGLRISGCSSETDPFCFLF